MNIRKKWSGFLNSVLILCIYSLIFSSTTIFYNKNNIFLIAVIIFFMLINKDIFIYKMKAIKIIWLMVGIFCIINMSYSKNFWESFQWVSLFIVCIMIIQVDFGIEFFIRIFRRVDIISLILAISIIINAFMKNLMIKYLSFLVKPGSLNYLNKEINEGIYSGLLAEKSFAAVAMIIGIGIIFSQILVDKKIKTRKLIYLIIYFIGIFLTGKRSLLLIPIFCMLFIFVIYNGKYKYRKFFSLLITSVILIGLATKFIPQTRIIVERLSMTIDKGTINTSGRDTVLWPIAMEMYEENKTFGYGLNSYNDYFTYKGIWGKKWNSHAHNIYIQLLAETGIIGIIIFCIAFISTLIHTIYIIKKQKENLREKEKILLIFSLYIQIFWLTYGISGNPLYNIGQVLLYVLAISITKEIIRKKKICKIKV